MIKKLIIPTLAVFALAANASALTGKGTFKKTTQKIKGSWTLAIVQDQQIIGFDKAFKTESAPNLKLVLTKQSLRSFKKATDFGEYIDLAPLKSSEGFQYYIVPTEVNISDYKSLVIHSEGGNVVLGGFSIPRRKKFNDEERGSAFEDVQSYGS
ncbi:MAG: DM13 domain-containing protein [Maricaulaceae bacterium]